MSETTTEKLVTKSFLKAFGDKAKKIFRYGIKLDVSNANEYILIKTDLSFSSNWSLHMDFIGYTASNVKSVDGYLDLNKRSSRTGSATSIGADTILGIVFYQDATSSNLNVIVKLNDSPIYFGADAIFPTSPETGDSDNCNHIQSIEFITEPASSIFTSTSFLLGEEFDDVTSIGSIIVNLVQDVSFAIKDSSGVSKTYPTVTSFTSIETAGSANKLSSAKTISLTGDVTGSVSTDLSGNPSITTTLINRNTADEDTKYNTFKVNKKGLITFASQEASSMPTATESTFGAIKLGTVDSNNPDHIPVHLDQLYGAYIIASSSSDTHRFETMPTASADYVGKIYEFIGTSTTNYIKGYFYTCTPNFISLSSVPNAAFNVSADAFANFINYVKYNKWESGADIDLAQGIKIIYDNTNYSMTPNVTGVAETKTLSIAELNALGITRTSTAYTVPLELTFNSSGYNWVQKDVLPKANYDSLITTINNTLANHSASIAAINDPTTGKADLVDGKLNPAQLPGSVSELVEGRLYNSYFYTVTTSEPEDWATSYTDYYTYDSTTLTFSPVTGSTAPTWQANTYWNKLTTGSANAIYVDIDDLKTYRWSGSAFIEISSSLALGETATTAYRGDRGKIAYDHSLDANRVTTASTSGFYKFGVTSEGHIASVTPVLAADITSLVPAGSSVSYSATLTSGSAIGTLTIGSTAHILYAPTTVLGANIIAKTSTATSAESGNITNGSVFLNHVANSAAQSFTNIIGTNGVEVIKNTANTITILGATNTEGTTKVTNNTIWWTTATGSYSADLTNSFEGINVASGTTLTISFPNTASLSNTLLLKKLVAIKNATSASITVTVSYLGTSTNLHNMLGLANIQIPAGKVGELCFSFTQDYVSYNGGVEY